MLKLLICDDEESIRTGLKCIVDWEELGFTICTESANGNEALQAIKDYQPDLVLLDIKMPGLTGIEVMEKVDEHCKSQGVPLPAFLILSGFSQFEYAQKALNLGAKGYILKPVDEDILTEKVKEIVRDINNAKSIEADTKTAKKFETQEFYKNVLLNGADSVRSAGANFSDTGTGGSGVKNGNPTNVGGFGAAGEIGIIGDNDDYTVLVFSHDSFPNDDKSLIPKCIENYFSFFFIVILNIDGNTVLLLKNANEEAVKNCIERFAKRYPEKTFITKGKKLKGFGGAAESYKEAKKYLDYLFYISDKNAVSEAEVLAAKEVDSSFEHSIADAVSKLIFCVETYDKSNLEEELGLIKSKLFQIEKKPSDVKKNMISLLVEMRNRLTAKYPERELADAQSFDVISHILEKRTFGEAFDYFKNVLYELIENFNTNTADSVIVKVIAYVKKNFASDLKLESLGDMFNCNSAYLGKKFKKYTGVQFNTYLDNLRIEEAKEKILHTDLKIYQISKLVGYSNTDYFFMKFKKATGLTPKEFKAECSKE